MRLFVIFLLLIGGVFGLEIGDEIGGKVVVGISHENGSTKYHYANLTNQTEFIDLGDIVVKTVVAERFVGDELTKVNIPIEILDKNNNTILNETEVKKLRRGADLYRIARERLKEIKYKQTTAVPQSVNATNTSNQTVSTANNITTQLQNISTEVQNLSQKVQEHEQRISWLEQVIQKILNWIKTTFGINL